MVVWSPTDLSSINYWHWGRTKCVVSFSPASSLRSHQPWLLPCRWRSNHREDRGRKWRALSVSPLVIRISRSAGPGTGVATHSSHYAAFSSSRVNFRKHGKNHQYSPLFFRFSKVGSIQKNLTQIPSHPIPFHAIPSHPIPSHPISSHPIPFHTIIILLRANFIKCFPLKKNLLKNVLRHIVQ